MLKIRSLASLPRSLGGYRYLSSDPQVPESADVVVIGGGIAGCNTIYQLSKRKVNAVLLEKSKLTAGSTWHTNGIVWSLRPTDVDMQLLANSQRVYKALEGETGIYSGWTENGGLFISHSDVRTNEYERLNTLGKAFGIHSEMLDPDETCKLFPLMDKKSFTAALYSPSDGIVDPAMACAGLAKYAKDRGNKVLENCSVQSIELGINVLGNKEVRRVVTPFGTINTKCVVNCGGAWSTKVATLAGISNLPLVAMKHAYVITDAVEGARGCPNVRDHDASMCIKVQGDSFYIGGYEPDPILIKELPDDFDFQLYELDWGIFAMHVESASQIIPVIGNTGIKSTIYGPESFTPDHRPLLGEDTEVFGLYHNCGYNSGGMMYSAGCAIEMAEWIVSGRPNLPMFPYDIRRFTPEQMRNSGWLNQRSHEAYAKNYACVFPNEQPLAGRGICKDALHDTEVDDGAFMETKQGWELPGYFVTGTKLPVPEYDYYGAYDTPRNTDLRYEKALEENNTYGFSKIHDLIRKEAVSCRNSAALFNMSYCGKFALTGPDAQKVADLAFTADFNGDIGKSSYTCCLNSKGGIEADLIVNIIDEDSRQKYDPNFEGRGFYLVSSGFNSYHTQSHIRKIINQYSLKANLKDVTKDVCILSLQGPKSSATLQKYVNTDLTNDAFPLNSNKSINVIFKSSRKGANTTVQCRAVRVPRTGELGWELHVPSDYAVQLYNVLKSEKDVTVGGWRAFTSLGAEKGYHLWNSDMTVSENPIEANLESVCREHGYYIGKEHVEKAKKVGVAKKYAFFTIDERKALLGFETIYRNGEVAGYLRRGDYGFYLNKPIGTGYIRNTESTTEIVTDDYLLSGYYEIEIMGVKHKATIHAKSPFDPDGKRVFGIYE